MLIKSVLQNVACRGRAKHRTFALLTAVACSTCGGDSASPTAPTSDQGSSSGRLTITGQPPLLGETVQFSAVATRSGGSSETVTDRASWSSSDPDIATVTNDGRVTGILFGTAEITAKYQELSGTMRISIGYPANAVLPSHIANTQFGPGGPSPDGVDEVRWDVTVQALPNSKAYYYWATNVYWDSQRSAYFGLQPNGQPISGGPNHRMVLFSVFGTGTTAVTPGQCVGSADGGPGQTCWIPYSWSVGTPYRFVMRLAADDGLNKTWTGTVVDLSSGASTVIASWNVPSTWGLLTPTTVTFAEYWGRWRPATRCLTLACNTQPRSDFGKDVRILPRRPIHTPSGPVLVLQV